MNTPDDLAMLGRGVKDAFNRMEQGRLKSIDGRKEWLRGAMDLGVRLLEARKRFVDHAEFGDWLKQSGVDMDSHERAALIEMSKDRKLMREVMEKTTLWSFRRIYDQEFKALSKPDPYGTRTIRVEKPAPKPEPVAAKQSKRSEARVDYVQKLKQAKAEIKNKVTAEIDAKVEAKFQKLKDKLEREYHAKNEELNNMRKRAMLRLSSTDGLVKKEDDMAIIKCLHPDHVASLGPAAVAMHEAGWRAYHKYRERIIIKLPESGK